MSGFATLGEEIDSFLREGPWAVAGASTDRAKYGNKILRCYMQNGREPLYPLNPRAQEVEGLACYPDLGSLPEVPRAVSLITPPSITEVVVEEALELGIEHLWMQPGAESEEAIERAREHGASVIAGGACLLVVLGYRE